MSSKKDNVVLSLSGGMDSSTVLLKCLTEYENVTCISFDYGQKHKVELNKAKELVDYINNNPLREYVTYNKHYDEDYIINYNKVTHQIIKLDGLSTLLNSSLVDGGSEVPEGHYQEENMKESVVPNRNKIFSSIIQAIALSIANKTNSNCDIAMGIHAGDHDIYPDCRQEFRDADYKAFVLGNWDAEKVNYYTPYLDGMKLDILKDGEKLCEQLNLSFDEIYRRTFTSYKPILCWNGYPQYMCSQLELKEITPIPHADYKSASSVERVEAFIKLGRKDPCLYASKENGFTHWDEVVKHVKKVLEENNK